MYPNYIKDEPCPKCGGEVKHFIDLTDGYDVCPTCDYAPIFPLQLLQPKRKPHEKVPTTVLNLCYNYKGLIIGGSIGYILGETEDIPKDIDVIIPHDTWLHACRLIPKDAKVNSFGGFKFVEDGYEVDVWMDNAAEVLFQRASRLLDIRTLKSIKS